MIQTRKYLKSKPICKVTFKVPAELVDSAKTVAIAGEFNNWDPKTDKMTSLKDGSFKITKDLEAGQTYAFKYVVDGKTWINDTEADGFQDSGVSMEQNSLVTV